MPIQKPITKIEDVYMSQLAEVMSPGVPELAKKINEIIEVLNGRLDESQEEEK